MSRRIRTFAALLFHALLLQVSVLGGGMACASAWSDVARTSATVAAAPIDRAHDMHAAPATHDGHDGHDAQGVARHAQGVAPNDASGAPSPHHGDVTHCATTTGCAAVAVLGPTVTPAALAAVHARAEAAPVTLPLSTRAAPEPPPPRA